MAASCADVCFVLLTVQYSVGEIRMAKYLTVRWGKTSSMWAMSMVSDKPATDPELRQMRREMHKSDLPW